MRYVNALSIFPCSPFPFSPFPSPLSPFPRSCTGPVYLRDFMFIMAAQVKGTMKYANH